MSRTIRRKHLKPWWLYDPDHRRWQAGNSIGSKVWLKEVRKYHNDNHPGIYSPPGWFVRTMYDIEKRYDKAQLHKYLKDPEYYEPVFSCYKKNAGWNWW